MKTNLFVLLGTLGCLCLATKVEAATSQAFGSEQTLRNNTSRGTVAQVIESPSSDIPAPDSSVIESPSSDAPAPNNSVIESPSSDVPASDDSVIESPSSEVTESLSSDAPVPDSSVIESPSSDVPASDDSVIESPSSDVSDSSLESSTSQAYEQIDQNTTAVREQRLTEAQQRTNDRIAQENKNRADALERDDDQPIPSPRPSNTRPNPQQPHEQRTQTSHHRQKAASTVTTSDRQDETSESLVAQVPPESEVVTKMLELENFTFQCGENNGVPATIAKINNQDDIPVILWSSNFFAEIGYDPQVRCEQVTARFEAYRKTDSSLYFTFGKLLQELVICITSQENGKCGEGISDNKGLLFTLKPNTDSQRTLEALATILQNENQSEQKPLEE